MCQGGAQLMERHAPDAEKWVISKKCARAEESEPYELEVEGAQEIHEDEIETIIVDLVHLNKNGSLITTKLKMQVGKNIIEIPYKIDTGSEGNIMLLYIFKNCLKIQQKISLKNQKKVISGLGCTTKQI